MEVWLGKNFYRKPLLNGKILTNLNFFLIRLAYIMRYLKFYRIRKEKPDFSL